MHVGKWSAAMLAVQRSAGVAPEEMSPEIQNRGTSDPQNKKKRIYFFFFFQKKKFLEALVVYPFLGFI